MSDRNAVQDAGRKCGMFDRKETRLIVEYFPELIKFETWDDRIQNDQDKRSSRTSSYVRK